VDLLAPTTTELRHRPGRHNGNADALSRRRCECSACHGISRQEPNPQGSPCQLDVPDSAPPSTHCVRQLTAVDSRLTEEQRRDPDLSPVIKKMETSEVQPKWQQISPASPGAKAYWTEWDALPLENGVLMVR